MEKPRFEAQFKETKKNLETSRTKILEFLKQEALDERDKVRLTRVLQLVERYKPERELQQDDKVSKWRSYLETAYRFLPTPSRKKKTQRIDNISAHSYLLAEKTIASLRQLRSLDSKLENETTIPDEQVLNQERPTKVEREEALDTSLTLEYEKKNWGVERICLDGIQNHLPSDSKGERVWVRCFIDGKWVSLAEAKTQQDKIQAVRFADDGVGFDVKNLALLYSTKSDEKESRGQFGEGMKMMAAAALREGLEPEMESQTWRAKPTPKQVGIYDTRHQRQQNVQQLSFQVQHLEGIPMVGSRTTFWKPTEGFVKELMQIEQKVLGLREGFRPLFVGTTGDVVDTESGNIFVKGIFVVKKKTLLSYNFEDVETNRDRNTIVSDNLDRRIATIVQEISDKRLAKTILKKSIIEPDAVESSYYNLEAQHPSVWLDGFYEAFGKDAVLDTGFKIPEAFKDRKLNKVKLPSGMTSLLLRAGVKTDRESTPDFYEETIPTSLTLEYGKDIWNEERILLDAIQNHLPQDSGGSMVGLRFKTKDGKWHSFEQLPDFPNDQIDSVKIYDNGRGYDHRLLGFFYSTKGATESTGKFGEGLKMLCVAALRKNTGIVLRSQNWTATPRALRQEIDGKQIDQLVFDVVHAVKKQEMDDDKGLYQSSSTTFENPSAELLQEFRGVNKKVLALEKAKPVERTREGDILALDGGLVYVRELLIPGEHNLLFTYHLPRLEIKNRDRSFVDQNELRPAISGVLAEATESEVIRSFLFKAKLDAEKGEGKELLEFSIDFSPKEPENWKKIFEEVFGKDVAIRDVRSQDYDAMQQNKHVGLELVSFPSSVYRVLQRLGLPTYESRIQEMTDVEHIPNEELTEQERQLLEVLAAIDEYLPGNRPSDIRVYKKKTDEQKVAAGFSDGVSIHLHRDTLSDFLRAADVYVHEKTHHNTGGAQDASSGFRNYLTLALGKMVLDELKRVKPELIKE